MCRWGVCQGFVPAGLAGVCPPGSAGLPTRLERELKQLYLQHTLQVRDLACACSYGNRRGCASGTCTHPHRVMLHGWASCPSQCMLPLTGSTWCSGGQQCWHSCSRWVRIVPTPHVASKASHLQTHSCCPQHIDRHTHDQSFSSIAILLCSRTCICMRVSIMFCNQTALQNCTFESQHNFSAYQPVPTDMICAP